MSSASRRRTGPLALLSSVLMVVVLALVVALFLATRASNAHTTATEATVMTLRTEVAGQRAQVASRQTEIVQLQHTIATLQSTIVVAKTPTYQANGPHGYIVSFQIDRYSYVLYLQWVESNGFIHNGRMLTADNSVRQGSRSFQLSGVDDNGSFGFTAGNQGTTFTFTGTAHPDGTFTATALPWSVFYGFVGGTFTRTLHSGTMQEYNTAVANLASPPH